MASIESTLGDVPYVRPAHNRFSTGVVRFIRNQPMASVSALIFLVVIAMAVLAFPSSSGSRQ